MLRGRHDIQTVTFAVFCIAGGRARVQRRVRKERRLSHNLQPPSGGTPVQVPCWGTEVAQFIRLSSMLNWPSKSNWEISLALWLNAVSFLDSTTLTFVYSTRRCSLYRRFTCMAISRSTVRRWSIMHGWLWTRWRTTCRQICTLRSNCSWCKASQNLQCCSRKRQKRMFSQILYAFKK